MSQKLELKSKQCVDEYKNIHILDKMLGQGGQGVVFCTKDPDLAIKFVTDESGKPLTDKSSLKKYSQRFRRVRLLPIPEGLNISVPAALLENSAGYVMQLLSEMVPFSYFWLDGKTAEEKITAKKIPAWLSEAPEAEAKKIVHYCETGGLRRRLIALYKCSSLLARLHGNGLIYGDISPNNIFISEGLEHLSVWLIDADNIRFEITSGGSVVYTPKYGAPELVQGKDKVRPASDCHAFAVVAFYLLSLIHPFAGKKVDGTDDGDWTDDKNDEEDIENKVYAGFFPWVDDQNDDSNSSDSGLPRDLILSEKLKTLFETTFGKGRVSPWLRPAIYHWPEALAQAADTTIQCPKCTMTYYYDFKPPNIDNSKCPYCETLRPPMLLLQSYRWNGVDEPLDDVHCWRFVREIISNSKIAIPSRVVDDFTMEDSDVTKLSIAISDTDILIEKINSDEGRLFVAADGDQKNNFQHVKFKLKICNSPALRFWIVAELNSPRLILCSISEGGK